MFAILGLRALYFALAGIMQLFHHLHYGLSAILIFVGVKMLVSDFYKVPVEIALGIVAGPDLVGRRLNLAPQEGRCLADPTRTSSG